MKGAEMTQTHAQSTLARFLATTALLLAPMTSHADAHGSESFASPEAAAAALVEAAQTNDTKRLLAIFGPDATALVSSGDPTADAHLRKEFVTEYEQKHRWAPADNGSKILEAGKSDWPFPIPLVPGNGGWHFDTASGREEILNRRIGRNEFSAIQASLAFVDAEREYFARNPMGGTPQYARNLTSAPGKKNGLFWKTDDGEMPSPLGEFYAAARAQGYSGSQGPDAAYHGYVYRILLAQGPEAYGGSMDYIVDGAMTNGFALIARPAKHGASGEMTFLVNQTGIVYEKNLGPDTAELADKIQAFDPDGSWGVVAAEALTIRQ